MVKRLENLKNLFKEGSKNYEAAQLLLENKSYDEVKKIIPSITSKALYRVRGKLKSSGLLKKKKEVKDPPKVPDKVSQEERMEILTQLFLEQPDKPSVEQIGAMAEELGVTHGFLENLIEEKMKLEIVTEVSKVPKEERGNLGTPGNPNQSLRTVPIVLRGNQLKIPDRSNPEVSVSTDTLPLQTAPKEIEGDSKEALAKVIVEVLDERDRKIKAIAEEQMKRGEEEDRKAFEIVAKKFNVKPEKLSMLLNRQPRENMVKRINDLPRRNVSDSEKLSSLMEGLPPEQLRLLLKRRGGTTDNPMLAAFKYMDTEASLVDIMDELNLDFDRAIDLQTKYNKMKRLELERQQLDEPYLKAWFDIAKVLGEDMRRSCPEYHEVDGICRFWKMDELSKQYRDTFKGLFRSGKKKESGYFINVNTHPEVCAICPMGMMKIRGVAA